MTKAEKQQASSKPTSIPPKNHAEDKGEAAAEAADKKAAESPAAEAAPKTGKIKEIIALWVSGKTKKEIVELGYHPTTVSIQTARYDKEQGITRPKDTSKAEAKAKEKEEKDAAKAKEKADKEAKKLAEAKAKEDAKKKPAAAAATA